MQQEGLQAEAEVQVLEICYDPSFYDNMHALHILVLGIDWNENKMVDRGKFLVGNSVASPNVRRSIEESKRKEMENASWNQSKEGSMDDKKQIFILSGQSNMSGRGGVSLIGHKKWDGVVPPECRPDPSILRLTAGLQWEEAYEPLHADLGAGLLLEELDDAAGLANNAADHGDVRSDLDSPVLPFIQVAIASGDARFIERVREAQLGINLQNVLCVDALGLPLKEDNLHLTTEAQVQEAQVQLGNLLADAYLTHFAANAPCPT